MVFDLIAIAMKIALIISIEFGPIASKEAWAPILQAGRSWKQQPVCTIQSLGLIKWRTVKPRRREITWWIEEIWKFIIGKRVGRVLFVAPL